MYDTDVVKLALEALAAGFSERDAAELAGVPRGSVHRWKHGHLPHVRLHPKTKRRRWLFSEKDVERMRMMRGELGMASEDIAAEIGCCRNTVTKWAGDVVPAFRRSRSGTGKAMEEKIVRTCEEPGEASAQSNAPSEDIAALKRRIYQLELENDVMRELIDILKAGARAETREPTAREKAEAAARLRGKYPVADLIAVLQIPRSTCYWCWGHPEKADPDADIREPVVEIFHANNDSRGYRLVKHELESGENPVHASEKRVRRVMRQEHLDVPYYSKKRRHYNSYGGEASPAPENLVGRNFRAGLPNFLWLTDITEFRLPDAPKVYLSPIIDCFDGKPAAWRIGLHPTSELAEGSLLDAIGKREGWEKTVIHDDRGIQYRSHSWIEICEEHSITRSMSAKGCSPDNSACEGFFGRLKNEFFYYRDWRGVTAEEFMQRLDAYLRYYCEGRRKESLGWMSPNEYRRILGFTA